MRSLPISIQEENKINIGYEGGGQVIVKGGFGKGELADEWDFIIMTAMRQRTNEDAICGWGQGNETTKYIQVFPPSPLKRTIFPQLAANQLSPLPSKNSYNTLKPKPGKLPLKRLKSQIFTDPLGGSPAKEAPSTRLFPSLPKLPSKEKRQVDPLKRQEVREILRDKFLKYGEIDQCINLKLLENKSSTAIREERMAFEEQNPETILTSQRKHPLKLSTIEIITKDYQSLPRSPKIKRLLLHPAERLLPIAVRAKRSHNRSPSHQDQLMGIRELPSRELLGLPPSEDKCFSDQTIFPQLSSASLTLPMPHLPQQVRLVVKPK